MHRALTSLMEELEAVDWYGQRIDASGDADLAGVLAHNRSEEIEHACMVLEWIRRHDAGFDRNLRQYLFSSSPIEEERGDQDRGSATPRPNSDGTLRIGSLRAVEMER